MYICVTLLKEAALPRRLRNRPNIQNFQMFRDADREGVAWRDEHEGVQACYIPEVAKSRPEESDPTDG